jgi:hypothetical protein
LGAGRGVYPHPRPARGQHGLVPQSSPARTRQTRPSSETSPSPRLIYARLRCSVGQDRSEITEQVVKFSPKQQSGIPADEAGQAVIAQIRKAAELANENCDRAMALAHKACDAAQSGGRSNYSIRGRGRAPSRPGDPSRGVASNNPQRTRAKAHRPEISLSYRTNIGLIRFRHGTKPASRCLWNRGAFVISSTPFAIPNSRRRGSRISGAVTQSRQRRAPL